MVASECAVASEFRYGMEGLPITWEKLWFSITTINTWSGVGRVAVPPPPPGLELILPPPQPERKRVIKQKQRRKKRVEEERMEKL